MGFRDLSSFALKPTHPQNLFFYNFFPPSILFFYFLQNQHLMSKVLIHHCPPTIKVLDWLSPTIHLDLPSSWLCNCPWYIWNHLQSSTLQCFMVWEKKILYFLFLSWLFFRGVLVLIVFFFGLLMKSRRREGEEIHKLEKKNIAQKHQSELELVIVRMDYDDFWTISR